MSSSRPRSLKDIAFEVAFSKIWVIELEEKYVRNFISFHINNDLPCNSQVIEDYCTDYFTIKEKSSIFYTRKEEAIKALHDLEEELGDRESIPCHGDESIPLINKLFPNRKLINEDLESPPDMEVRDWYFEIEEIPLRG